MRCNLPAWFKPKVIRRRAGIHTSMVFRYKVGYRRNGVNYFTHDWQDNLILDSGLNKVGTVFYQTCWNTCLFGNPVSPNPVRRDSLATTFTVTGTSCVSSVGFFVSQDVGRLIKFNDAAGQEFYINAFTNSTTVTLSAVPSPAITAQTGTIWYVNQTALDTLFATTQTFQAGGANNGTTYVSNVMTMKRTFLGSAVGAPVTLTEIGFNNSVSNASIFDRDIIAGGVSLLTGDQPLAVAQLIITFHPETSTVAGNVGTGFDTSGTIIICGLGGIASGQMMIQGVDTNGGGLPSTGGGEPSNNTTGLSTITGAFTLPAFSNGVGATIGAGTGTGASSTALGTYSAGSFFRDKVCSWITSAGNATITGFSLGSPLNGGGVGPLLCQRFTTSFTKLNTQVLTLTLRASWQRILVN